MPPPEIKEHHSQLCQKGEFRPNPSISQLVFHFSLYIISVYCCVPCRAGFDAVTSHHSQLCQKGEVRPNPSISQLVFHFSSYIISVYRCVPCRAGFDAVTSLAQSHLQVSQRSLGTRDELEHARRQAAAHPPPLVQALHHRPPHRPIPGRRQG